jgi:hypothetical protein
MSKQMQVLTHAHLHMYVQMHRMTDTKAKLNAVASWKSSFWKDAHEIQKLTVNDAELIEKNLQIRVLDQLGTDSGGATVIVRSAEEIIQDCIDQVLTPERSCVYTHTHNTC